MGALEVQDTIAALVSSVNPSAYGQPVTLTATVTPVWEPGTVAPTGTVTFYDDGTAIGTGTLAVVGGLDEAAFTTSRCPQARLRSPRPTPAATPTSHPAPSSAAVSQVVKPDGTTTAVTSSANSSVSGRLVTFTATVTTSGPGTFDNGGAVQFTGGRHQLRRWH